MKVKLTSGLWIGFGEMSRVDQKQTPTQTKRTVQSSLPVVNESTTPKANGESKTEKGEETKKAKTKQVARTTKSPKKTEPPTVIPGL